MSDAGPESLVGLLAEESRLKVVAAVVLGAATEGDVTAATGLVPKTVRKALDRLVRGGLVEMNGRRPATPSRGSRRRPGGRRPSVPSPGRRSSGPRPTRPRCCATTWSTAA